MRLKRRHLFVRVVIEDPELKVVAAGYEPVFAGDELGASDGDFGYFEGFGELVGCGVVDVDGAVVERCEEPGLGGVEVDGFDAVRAREELFIRRLR